jgi:hypothetical protein
MSKQHIPDRVEDNYTIPITHSRYNSIAHLNVSDRLNAKVVEMAKITRILGHRKNARDRLNVRDRLEARDR